MTTTTTFNMIQVSDHKIINKLTKINLPNPRYVRKGKCNRCGFCCKYHGCKDLIMKDGIATCAIYKNRPDRCKVFPEAPPILTETCGYWFEDTWENNKIVKYGRDL